MVGRFEGRGRAVWVFERDFMVFFGWELFLFSIMPQSFSCSARIFVYLYVDNSLIKVFLYFYKNVNYLVI